MSKEIVKGDRLVAAVSREVDGLEMGVLSDGRAYLSSRALSRLTGTAYSTIIENAQRWLEGKRDGKLAQLLASHGLNPISLYVEVEKPDVIGGKVHAYTDDVAMVILEYYAYVAQRTNETALSNFRKLAHASLKLFVYRAVGYDPASAAPDKWRQFHDRLALNSVPLGYFSVFRELGEVVIFAIQRGLPCDEHTVPDISVGIQWANHWKSKGLETQFGPRRSHDHNYPEYFAQSRSNPQDISIYPNEALPEFRQWLMTVYLPEKFPKYLRSKVASRALPASTADLLITEMAEMAPALPEAGK